MLISNCFWPKKRTLTLQNYSNAIEKLNEFFFLIGTQDRERIGDETRCINTMIDYIISNM